MDQVSERMLIEQPTAVLRQRLSVPEIGGWIGSAYARVMAAISAAGTHPVGMPFARYAAVPDEPSVFDVEAGFPVAQPLPAETADGVLPSTLPDGRAAVTVHVGPYETMAPAYEALGKWIADAGGSPDGPPWECYLDEPIGDPATWRTEIVQPYRRG